MKRVAYFASITLALVIGRLVALPAPGEHDYGKWEKEISAFEQSDRTNPPPRGGYVFIGSSTVRLWKTIQTDFPGQRIINRGFGGSEIVDSTHFADRVIFPYQPKRIYLRAGGNDLWAGKGPEQVVADFKEFVSKMHDKLPEADVIFISLSPSISRWKQADKEKAVNTMIHDIAQKTPKVKYIETYDLPLGADGQPRAEVFVQDKLHFNADGYKLLAERVRPFVVK
jgi:hypothetical protein